MFEPLDFLAEMTQHVPNKGEHQIRYYGHYSNKSRGVREKALKTALVPKPTQTLTRQQLLLRLTWAALIDHDRQPDVVEKILRHCKLWREPRQRAPPDTTVADSQIRELTYDEGFFDRECA